ncbi:hypothetical protein SKAU_G00223570 [Synaphobranchus kaupii]|uniref:Uncharacterized protein n=1 Tax=Synaphobranchus kaupii TaxID=118154 RepID=A0A9Q1FBE4_SYNKA|nr:hypothetical protein SKAU_G00223570 [Synaphobranchus kaupii]
MNAAFEHPQPKIASTVMQKQKKNTVNQSDLLTAALPLQPDSSWPDIQTQETTVLHWKTSNSSLKLAFPVTST